MNDKEPRRIVGHTKTGEPIYNRPPDDAVPLKDLIPKELQPDWDRRMEELKAYNRGELDS